MKPDPYAPDGEMARIEVDEAGAIASSTLSTPTSDLAVHFNDRISWLVLHDKRENSFEVCEIEDVEGDNPTPGNFIYTVRRLFEMPAQSQHGGGDDA